MAALPTAATIGVIGAGTMGAGIVQIAAHAGHPVLLYDSADGANVKALARIANDLGRLVERGKLCAGERDAILGRIMPIRHLEDLAPARLVLEVIVEKLDIKRQIFSQIEEICGNNTILATNTSSISITAIGAALKRPSNLVGMHFFNPAPLMKLVEVISGIATRREVAQTIFDTAKSWGKQPVHAKSTPGFIVNRVARPFYAEGMRVMQEGGADPATIDALLREAGGFRMGPFELMDLIGHDVNFAVTSSVFAAYFNDPRFLPSLLQQELVSAGYLGRKAGRGFYDYSEGAERPAPHTAPAGSRPERVILRGGLGIAEPLAELIQQAGIALERRAGDGLIELDAAVLALSDGRFATERAASDGLRKLVLFDLALDYGKATRIALAPADQAGPAALNAAVGLFQALGKPVSVIADIPGMVVLRTVCMLANEGADAVNQQVCEAAAVDTAMQNGVNYPRGPLAWADAIGLPVVLRVLDNLASTYGEDRYRASPLLRRKALGGNHFHG